MNRKRKNKLNLVRRKKPAWAKVQQDQAAREQHQKEQSEAEARSLAVNHSEGRRDATSAT